MRQAEEEWLLSIARGFGVNVRIRQLEKAYSYERSELASAIGGFLNDIKLAPANVPGVNNRFIASLVKGDIENFGSHFQDAPYGDGSIGDEKTRWDEFKAFRCQFECVCGRTKYQRPYGLKKPVCAHENCETQFAFKPLLPRLRQSPNVRSSRAGEKLCKGSGSLLAQRCSHPLLLVGAHCCRCHFCTQILPLMAKC